MRQRARYSGVRLVSMAALVLACGSQPEPPTTITNHAAAAEPAQRSCEQGLFGTVVERGNVPAIGATIVASRRDASPRDDDEEMPVFVTDEEGRFTLAKVGRLDRLTIYYNDTTYEGALPRGCEAVVIEIGGKGRPGDVHPFTVRPRR